MNLRRNRNLLNRSRDCRDQRRDWQLIKTGAKLYFVSVDCSNVGAFEQYKAFRNTNTKPYNILLNKLQKLYVGVARTTFGGSMG